MFKARAASSVSQRAFQLFQWAAEIILHTGARDRSWDHSADVWSHRRTSFVARVSARAASAQQPLRMRRGSEQRRLPQRLIQGLVSGGGGKLLPGVGRKISFTLSRCSVRVTAGRRHPQVDIILCKSRHGSNMQDYEAEGQAGVPCLTQNHIFRLVSHWMLQALLWFCLSIWTLRQHTGDAPSMNRTGAQTCTGTQRVTHQP